MLSTISKKKSIKPLSDINLNPNDNIFLKSHEDKHENIIKNSDKSEQVELSNLITNLYARDRIVEDKPTIPAQSLNIQRPPPLSDVVPLKKPDDDITNVPKPAYVLTNENFEVMVNFDKPTQTFNFYNTKKEQLGSLNGGMLFDHIVKCVEPNSPYESCEIVKKFIVKDVVKGKDKDVILYDYNNSPFMGDIELLIRLNNQLDLNKLSGSLNAVSAERRDEVNSIAKLTVYKLLNHTLKMISIASDRLVQKGGKSELKDTLLNYSVNTVYKITEFVKDEIETLKNKNQKIEKTLDLCKDVRTTLNGKMDTAISQIKKQNESLIFLADKMKDYEAKLDEERKKNQYIQSKMYHLRGGNRDDRTRKNTYSDSYDKITITSMSESKPYSGFDTTDKYTEDMYLSSNSESDCYSDSQSADSDIISEIVSGVKSDIKSNITKASSFSVDYDL